VKKIRGREHRQAHGSRGAKVYVQLSR